MTKSQIAYIILFSAALAVYLVIVLWSLPLIATEAGGMAPFDLRPAGYGFAETKDFLSALSEAGRAQYLGAQALLDWAYPALLALTLGIGTWHLLGTIRSGLRITLMAFPILTMVFDYLENARVRALLLADPGSLDAKAVSAASSATVLKSAVTSIAMLVLLIAIIMRGVTWWRRRGRVRT